MTATLRMDPLDLDVAHDEELPGYEEAATATAPAYDSGTYDEPLITYRLRQYDRKIQMLVADGVHDAPVASSYRITSNTFRVFSKRPEIEVLRTSQHMRQRSIAAIDYDKHGGFPWKPRAHFDYATEDGESTLYRMESLNFEDWTIKLGDRTYTWAFDMRPISLILREKDSTIVIARFIYSEKGVLAMRGAEVGELVMYRDSITMEDCGMDKVVCGLMVVVTFLKKMGRNYTNQAGRVERGASVTREMTLPSLHRGSAAGYSNLGNWAG